MRYKISNHTPLITVVCQLEPEVFIPMTGREGPGHTQNTTILFLKDTHSQTKFDHRKSTNIATTGTAQPRQHQNAHNDISATPQHNGKTHFLGGWSNATSTQLPTLHMQTILQPDTGSSCSLTDRLGIGWARIRVGGVWQR